METDLRGVKAFWITPDGEIHPVDTNHMLYVSQNPELFNATSEYLIGVFRKHREKPILEGNARAEIIRGLVNQGYIRIRKYLRNPNYLTIQCSDYESNENVISDFTELALKEGVIHPDDEIRVSDNRGTYFLRISGTGLCRKDNTVKQPTRR